MPCNDINNFSFEHDFDYWCPAENPLTTSWVQSGTAYAGEKFLAVATTPTTPIGIVSQDLFWLDDETPYELTVQVRLVEPFGAVEDGCTVSAHLGEQEIAAEVLKSTEGDWTALTGSIQPSARNLTFSLMAACGFGAHASEELQGQVQWDEVLFGPLCD
ncbi:uncharacterized protein BO97DRAFT_378033 [Aspergillus homomorphus CBS 101889]|uniref:CBM-cenC domain-containing protein n=1 Tax=Aspergillus homomorphus (strain CBS 101889) TaxID=1450537 RepID=A0A395HII1_ASPHC|nr:hypothetical protein BO97DRAFT_378033 [Aspergillus homomorphus CBS 101889]RAL07617.1 hypothetical protein BO97DRAFT_378033 [Aspergillus homomorphus CBS 101889]